MRLLFTFLSLFVCSFIFSQQGVAINTDGTAPDTKAILDIKSTDKGLLIPRMTTEERTGIATPPKGLTVFDNTTSSFWFYDGVAWMEMPAANKIWKLDGNAGTNANINFMGTTDNKPLVFKVNNFRAGYIYGTNTAFGYQSFMNNTAL